MGVFIPSKGSQLACMPFFVGLFAYVRMIIFNFAQAYAPPELFGTLQGGIWFVIAVDQIVFASVFGEITLLIFSEGSYWKYGTQFLIWTAGILLTGSLMFHRFVFQHPLQEQGVACLAE